MDPACIAVIGTSYGGYLATLLSMRRPVRWLALRVPALYWDEQWQLPKRQLDVARLAVYRRTPLRAEDNLALRACSDFHGDVLLVESEHDDFVPHTTLMSYRNAFDKAHSLTHRIMAGADPVSYTHLEVYKRQAQRRAGHRRRPGIPAGGARQPCPACQALP